MDMKEMPMPSSDEMPAPVEDTGAELDLSVLSDEELMAEVKKRGLSMEEEGEAKDDMEDSAEMPPMPA